MKPIYFFGGTLALLVFSAATTLTQAMATPTKQAHGGLAGTSVESVGHFSSAVRPAGFSFTN